MKQIYDFSSVSKAATYEQIGEYWDTHSLDEHWDETSEVKFDVGAKRQHHITVIRGAQMFNETGYQIAESVFSAEECDNLASIIGISGVERGRGGTRNLMRIPAVVEFANDYRLLKLTETISTKKLVPYKATLFEKTGKANWLVAWHQDTALPVETDVDLEGWGSMSVKDGVRFVHAPTDALSRIVAIRIHLDSSNADNGPLRVIPGSHSRRWENDAEFQETVSKNEQVECLVDKGGVIAMSPLLIHASSKAKLDAPRRVLHIEYVPSLEIAPGIRLAIA